jgi:autotransporter translocation and assembly factor TamB
VTGTDTSSGAVQIEVQVTPDIAVEVEAGAAAQNSVGVFWEHDY